MAEREFSCLFFFQQVFFFFFKMVEPQAKKPQIFEESSQYQHWRFSPQQLWDIRNKRTKEAVDRVERNMQEELVKMKRIAQHVDHSLLMTYYYRLQTMNQTQLLIKQKEELRVFF